MSKKVHVIIQKNACQHTPECMPTFIRNFNMHEKKSACQNTKKCLSTYIRMHVRWNMHSKFDKFQHACKKKVHVNIQINACQHAFFSNMHVEEKSHVNIQPLFLMAPTAPGSGPATPCVPHPYRSFRGLTPTNRRFCKYVTVTDSSNSTLATTFAI
jgi:hypothetical protein